MKLTALLAAIAFAGPSFADTPPAGQTLPTPVILDTDIGDDIDDTWALALLLRCPELDLKLAVGANHNAELRGRLLAKLLDRAGRTDVPVGLGVRGADWPTGQDAWLEGYKLADYPGAVHDDGVDAMIRVIMQSPEPVTVIAIGPLQNVAEALRREPRIANRARFIGMHGSLRKGYGGSDTPAAEFNVREAPAACREVFQAAWEKIITPLDTCGVFRLTGAKHLRIAQSRDQLLVDLMDNYRVWWDFKREEGQDPDLPTRASSTLFDAVAVYLAINDALCEMESLRVKVLDDGRTTIVDDGPVVRAAMGWRDLAAFEDWTVARLTGTGN